MLAHSFAGNDNGPLVVFLHAVGTTSWMWEPVVERLQDYHCLLIDLPGHGDSKTIAWQSFEHTAEQVRQTIQASGKREQTHIVGLSLGSYVGLSLLALEPTVYKSATLSGLHSGGMPNRALMRLVSWLMAPFAVRPFFARKNGQMLGGTGTDLDAYVREAGKTDVASFRRASIDAVNFEMPQTVRAIQTKVMIAAGSREHTLILKTLPTLVEALPHGKSHIAEGLGHGWSLEDPAQFADLVAGQVEGKATSQQARAL